MANKKFSLLKGINQDIKNDEYNENIIVPKENKNIEKVSKYGDLISKAPVNTYPILDKSVISFVVSHFPEVSKDIVSSLDNLKDTLEKSIDYIEDTSSQIIKRDRNFDLSTRYRNNAMNLYEMSISIDDYIKWMDTQSISIKENESPQEISKVYFELLDENSFISSDKLTICNDFTDKEPKYFILDNFNVPVEDWNDLIIKTADLLTKNYKKSKTLYYSNIESPNLPSKKSIQNEFRDTVIEILIEYRIEPTKYSIIIK